MQYVCNLVAIHFYTNENIFFQLDLPIHLTNYSIDENNTYDDLDTDNGKKHSLRFLFEHLKKEKRDVDKLWKEIQVKEIFNKKIKISFVRF